MTIEDFKPPPPPRKEDVLFRDDLPDWGNNACLSHWGSGNHYAYTEGYLRGARTLVERVVSTSRDQDVLLYPIIFLYRHHIELVLKKLIARSPYLIDRELTDAEKQHLCRHRLDLLWNDLKPMMEDICKAAGWDRLDPEDAAGIDSYIRQLVKLDPDSYSFRYTHSKKGDPSLPSDLKRINVRHFSEMMERLASYLDTLDTATDHLVELKSEMEAEWRSEMASYMDGGY
jgi:hypothetical protein